MKHLIQTNSLSELLSNFQQEPLPILVKLNTREGADYLMDIMIDRLLKGVKYEVLPMTLDQDSSKRISQALHLQSNPSLLFIHKGEIKSILSGITSRHQIEEALTKLHSSESKGQAI